MELGGEEDENKDLLQLKNSERKEEEEVGDGSWSVSSTSINTSEEDYSYDAPDGGWGWVVVFGSFIVNLIADGITFSFGILFVELQKEFGESKAVTAGVVSLFHSVPLLSGPLASALADRYGCKAATIVGSILATLGFILSSLSESIGFLYFSFGVVAGFGLSLCYVAAIVIVAFYFDAKRSFATGISVCGSGVGTFIFAPFTRYLVKEYDWRGATLILGGCCLQMVLCGLLFKDLEWSFKSKPSDSLNNNARVDPSKASRERRKTTSTPPRSLSFEEAVEPKLESSSLVDLPSFLSHGEVKSSEEFTSALRKKNYKLAYRLIRDGMTAPLQQNEQDQRLESSVEDQESLRILSGKRHLKRKMSSFFRKNSTLTGLTPPLPIEKRKLGFVEATIDICPAQDDLGKHTYRMKMSKRPIAQNNIVRFRLKASSCPNIFRVPSENAISDVANEKKRESRRNRKKRENDTIYLTDEYGISSYFRSCSIFTPEFNIFCLSNLILYSWYDVMYVYLIDYTERDLSFGTDDATFLISVIGIFNTMGEIIVGWSGDKSWINMNLLYAVCMIICGVATAAVPFLTRYSLLAFMAGLYGFAISANYSLTAPILIEIVSLQQFSTAYGFLLLVQGLSNLVGPPFAGYLYDVTSVWVYTFGIAGFCIALSGLLLLVIPIMTLVKNYRSNHCDISIGATQGSGEDEPLNSVVMFQNNLPPKHVGVNI